MDRPHITHDILKVFRKYDISMTWMEVYTYVIYIKFPKIEIELWKKMKKELLEIYAVKEIDEIDLIAVEEREVEMKSVLDIVSQGIIMLNKEGKIKYANKYAAESIFSVSAEQAVNQKITRYLRNKKIESFINLSDKNKSIENMEIQISHHTYFLNINPVLSQENIFCGYIITLQNMEEIGEIINSKRYDNPITFDDIVGKSTKLLEVINHAKLFSPSDSPVLITGESGTGKELFARAIHNHSRRWSKLFVAINCAAIPDQLLESELFGYESGAFTGGKKNGKTGIFEVANGGTVFLDEIGEMAPHLQVKLLRVLQEGTIRRIGGHEEIPIDVRVLSATNQDIEKMVKANKFRLDLLYRINIFNLDIPPLRERKEDLEVLIDYFKKIYEQNYHKQIEGITRKALEKLLSYSWPGNIRELQNVIERAVALTRGKDIEEKDILLNYNLEAVESIERTSLKESVENFEKDMIIKALKNHSSIRETARALGVSHTLLINRIKKYNINS